MAASRPHAPCRIFVIAFAIACAVASIPASGATSSSVVGANVLAATTVGVTGCLQGVAGRTDFGSMLPGTSSRTTDDCVVQFGATNANVQLTIRQEDHAGKAMFRPTTGALDTGYGGGAGFVVAALAGSEEPIGSGVDATGRMFVLYNSSAVATLRVARFTAAGALDVGWGTGGFVTTTIDDPSSEPSDIYVYDDGSFIVAGAQGTRAAVEKRTSAGAPDGTFGTAGVALTPNSGSDRLHAVTVDESGNVVAAGQNDNNANILIARFSSAGVLDPFFGTGGIVTPNLVGTIEGALFISQAPSGGYFVGGWYDGAYGGTNDAYIYRTLPTGGPDTTFSGDGMVDTIGLVEDDWPIGAWQDSAGRVSVMLTGDATTRLGRLNAAGTAWDGTFAGGGLFTLPGYYWFGTRTSAGDFVFAGTRTTGFDDTIVTRYGPDGAVDGSLGTSGVQAIDTQPGADESGWYVREGIDGDLLIAGSTSANGQIVATSLMGLPVDDYNDIAGDDWAAGNADFFGACLVDASAAATATWSEAGTCGTTDGLAWNDVPVAPDLVASGPAQPGLHDVHLRFAVRFHSSQQPGRYTAPLEFNVVAP